ncbi:chemotaxis protein histidine kinase CheA [Leifsonia aquatica]|uniref:Chemotaxis protein histidine kinase CheA n=2 Tax=Leifsonia aquatica TaxID=144185 RepID=A0A7W4YI05_LEIAQ|nr:chemotaxis protein histidine kinase CheA [Leifsonia aquatica]
MRRMWTASAAATALIGALVLAGGAAPAAADTSYPSWDDVQAAKANATAAQAEVDRINALLAGLQTAANAAGDLAIKRAGEYGAAETALKAATQKADDLSAQATAATAQADTLRTQSGTLASQLVRAGGSNVTLRLFLGSSTTHQKSLLYELGAVSKLTQRSTALLAAADQQKNVAAALSTQAAAAETVRTKLDADAKKAYQTAKDAEAAAEAELADQKSHANTLYSQLATLKNTEASVEQSYAAGEAAKAAAEAAANPGGGSDGFAPPPGMVVDPAAAQAYASSRLAAYGWGQDQMGCLIKLWNHESGWRADAYNSSSGAYGIPQSWPGSKMASAGADWMTNQNTQVNWGLDYINRAYGSPCAAWNFEMSHDPNWY